MPSAVELAYVKSVKEKDYYSRNDKKVAKDLTDEKFINQLKDDYNLHGYDVSLLSGQKVTLKKEEVEYFSHSAEMTIITKCHLYLGIHIPLYDPSHPFIYEVLSQIRPSRALDQWNGNTYLIMDEWERQGKGESSPTPWSTYYPSQESEYTSASFVGNYWSGTATNGDLAGFAVIPHRNKVPTGGFKKLLLYEDPEGVTNTNKHALHTSDVAWDRVPLAIRGPILSGNLPPPRFPAKPYPFCVVNYVSDEYIQDS